MACAGVGSLRGRDAFRVVRRVRDRPGPLAAGLGGGRGPRRRRGLAGGPARGWVFRAPRPRMAHGAPGRAVIGAGVPVAGARAAARDARRWRVSVRRHARADGARRPAVSPGGAVGTRWPASPPRDIAEAMPRPSPARRPAGSCGARSREGAVDRGRPGLLLGDRPGRDAARVAGDRVRQGGGLVELAGSLAGREPRGAAPMAIRRRGPLPRRSHRPASGGRPQRRQGRRGARPSHAYPPSGATARRTVPSPSRHAEPPRGSRGEWPPKRHRPA